MNKHDILRYRSELFQTLLKEEDLAAILIVTPGREGFDVYFSGASAKTLPPYDAAFQSMDSCVLLRPGKKPAVIHASYLTAPGEADPLLTHFGPPPADPEDFSFILNQKAEIYLEALSENKRLGIVNPDDLRDELHAFITQYVPGVEFVDVTRKANLLKAEKCAGDLCEEEITAGKLDQLFAYMSTVFRPGITEHDAINMIRTAGAEIGNIGNIYSDWIIAHLTSAPEGGAAVAEPIPFPGRTLDFHDRINIHLLAALHNDYSAACARCFVIGQPKEETLHFWDLAVKAQTFVEAALRPGVSIAEIIAETNEKFYEPQGLPCAAGNWIYGMGLNFTMAEVPMAIPGYDAVPLKEGMFISAAPRIEVEGQDPYLCADTYVITANGCRRLTGSDRALRTLFDDKKPCVETAG